MFKVNVESSIGWIEMTETLEEAVELLRGLVEADGKHAFYNMTNFHNSGIKSKNASCQLQWVTEENGQVKLISKSIMWINYYEEQRKIRGNDYEENGEKNGPQNGMKLEKVFGKNFLQQMQNNT